MTTIEMATRPTSHLRQAVPIEERPHWVRPAFAALLLATAVLYVWNLSASGWANDFYAAAVQAGTQNWKALLFGSLDPGNAITVDKPPAAMWVMALSGRLFGFSSWSMLVPQALMGVASVALVYAAVRRVSGPVPGLLAGAVLALTPVAALMFRFNNPDALLVLLLVTGGYCMVRAVESASTRWIALAGAAVGFAFLTKMMQAFLVLPAFGAAFLIAAPVSVWRRLGKLAIAAVVMVVSGGWLVALVAVWPSGSRPYIGGSTDNSLLELALGYNGLGRVLGGEGNGGPGGGGGNTAFGGSTGITRLFGMSMGTEISWLLPAALIGLVAGLWFTRRTPRTDRTRASLVLWGGWVLVTGLVFSFMAGTVHPYYTVALAPGIAALIGISTVELWRGRDYLPVRAALGAMLAVTGVWNFILLDRTPEWLPALRWVLLVGSIVVASVLVAGGHEVKRLTAILAITGLLFGLGGTAAYAIDTAAQAHGGSIPTSGPSTGGFGGGPGGHGTPGSSENSAVEALIKNTDTRWAAATVGSHGAASLELSTGASVMAIGGFTGSDNSPTLAQFKQYVTDHEVGYFIADQGGPGGRGDGDGAASQISAWVKANFTAKTIGGTTVYELSS
ncbi:glycosyltransferase family 39 protein [Skermania sp. ID1734]|uniref:glycosyltransferase family 39 protein n=1 Tax=Skermania sp. ID1734 TaxID=2597516 RepID=UPI00117FBB11|nr:glycosyltransferase family 39 protein [Skermania sp. ID1734]TSD97237.1 glycosyltransferase family 39 protein [Skermania sp. ID1734]